MDVGTAYVCNAGLTDQTLEDIKYFLINKLLIILKGEFHKGTGFTPDQVKKQSSKPRYMDSGKSQSRETSKGQKQKAKTQVN